jgi:hypothetical protein
MSWSIVKLAFAFYLCFMLAFIICPAKAEILIEIGKTEFERPPNHTWWQDVDGYSRVFNLEDMAIRVGYFHPLTHRVKLGVSLFNLGSYSTVAVASDNEACIFANGTASASVCKGTLSTFNTEGSIRGLSVTGRYEKSFYFLEAGPIFIRQSFRLATSSNYTHNEALYGPGYVLGAGIKHKTLSLGVYVYESNVGGQFNDSVFPSGVGKVVVTMAGITF